MPVCAGVTAHPAYADASGYQTVNVSYQDVVSGNTLTYTSWYNDDFFETNAENGKLAKLSVALAAQTYVSAESIAEAVTSMGFTVCLQKNYDRIPTSADCDFVAYTIASRQIGDATLYGVFLRHRAHRLQNEGGQRSLRFPARREHGSGF